MSFQPKEWKAFEVFLEGRNFKHREDVQAIYRVAKEICMSSQPVEPAKTAFMEHSFPGRRMELNDFRYLEAELVQKIEEWWVWRELKQDRVRYRTILLKAMQKRSLQKPFRTTLDKAFQDLEALPHRDMEYLLLRYQLHNHAFEFASRQENRGMDPGLSDMLHDLKDLYQTGSLKYGSLMVNLGNVVQSPVEPETVQGLLSLGAESNDGFSPGAELYYHILLTLTDPSQETHYFKLLQLLDEKAKFFSQEEVGQLYAFALNYCIKKLNEGRSDYLERLFELYQQLLEKKAIFIGPYIQQQHFKNIVTTSVRLEQFPWTETFLRQYSAKVSPSARENATTYNWAYLHFARREYSAALRLLQEVEFTDVYYHVDSKALLLKTYYELEEWEPLLSLTEAFSNYLRRNKMLSDYQRKVYWNFVKFSKKLVRKRLGSRKPVAEIISEMERVREVADLRWLKLKAIELQ